MGEVDGRRLGDAVLEALRRRAVALARGGMAQRQIAAVLGVHWNTVGRWLQAWRRGGEGALTRKKRGRRPDEQLRLAPAQAAAIRRLIRDRCPDQLKLAFALWTREAVQALIVCRYGIKLSLASVGRYLRRWGFTPQKPLRRAIERDPEAVRRWLEETYPEIRARARAEGAEIHWGDESGISNQANHGRSFAPQGQTPVITAPGRRATTSMISSVTNRGQMRFMLYDGALNTTIFLRFLRRLIKGAERKIILILDNLKVHHARRVAAWVAARSERIELVFLPPYAPEHNPDEFLHHEVKQRLAQRPAVRHRPELKQALASILHRLQKIPERIRAFFQAPTTRYAAT
jgi:transposase